MNPHRNALHRLLHAGSGLRRQPSLQASSQHPPNNNVCVLPAGDPLGPSLSSAPQPSSVPLDIGVDPGHPAVIHYQSQIEELRASIGVLREELEAQRSGEMQRVADLEARWVAKTESLEKERGQLVCDR